MTSSYWKGGWKGNLRNLLPSWKNLMYALPPGCKLVCLNSSASIKHPTHSGPQIPHIESHYGDEDLECLRHKAFDDNQVDVKQECDEAIMRPYLFGNISGKWTYLEWLLTKRPDVFGLYDGLAYPTGIALVLIMTIMVICSFPSIRRGGHFEV